MLRGRGEKVKGGGSAGGWEDLAKMGAFENQQNQNQQNYQGQAELSPEQQERLNAERQQRKIVAAMLSSEDQLNPILAAHDISVSEQNLNTVLEGMAERPEEARAKEHQILSMIRSPLQPAVGGPEVVAEQIAYGSPKHERRILGRMSSAGFEGWDNVNVRNVMEVAESLPTPIEYEQQVGAFLEEIRRHNTNAKYQDYVKSAQNLEQKLYGKRLEYWNQMKVLEGEARRRFSGKTLELVGDDPQSDPGFKNVPGAVRLPERERNREQLIVGGSVYQMSRAQAREGLIASQGEFLPNDGTNQDAYLAMIPEGVFGVFDGVGGAGGGQRASQGAMESVYGNVLAGRYVSESSVGLADLLNEASRAVQGRGYTTGTLAQIVKDGPDKKLLWASVGDSRCYVVHPDGQADLLTADEGFENKITNALGYDKDEVCRQTGEYPLSPGDKIVLCSDGVTGDKGDELMEDWEMGQKVKNVGDVRFAAQALVSTARKMDDRTAVVVEV